IAFNGTGIVAGSLDELGLDAPPILGNAGNATVSADFIKLAGRAARISSVAQGTGKAGSIVLASKGDLIIEDGANVLVSSDFSKGGDVQLVAKQRLTLMSGTVSAAGRKGGGNVTITQPVFVILDHSRVLASATAGAGGVISIDSDFLLQSDSLLDASS